jgi:multiple sugar transport system substrate-binding protein
MTSWQTQVARLRIKIGITTMMLLVLLCSVTFAADKTAITFLWWGGNPNNFYETAKAEFESQYPNIEVQLVFADSESQIVKVIGGVGDAMITHAYTNGNLILSGLLKPLNSLVEKDPAFLNDLQKDFWPGSYLWAERNGTNYTLPFIWTQGLVMFYNKDLFQNTGLPFPQYKNWNDLVTPLKKFSSKEGQFGLQMVGNNWHSLHQMSLTNGGGLFDNPRFPTKGTMDSPRVLETANFWVNQATKEKTLGGAFAKGTAAMYIYWWGQIANWKNLPFSYDLVIAPPGPSGGNSPYYPAAVAMLGITAHSKHPEEAYQWLKFLLSPRMMKLATTAGAGVPTRRTVALLPEWAKSGGFNNQAVVQALMNAVPTQPLTPAIKEIDALLNPQLSAAFKGEKDIATVLRTSNDQLTALVQK